MKEKIFKTNLGDIHYWVNILDKNAVTLVLLPGLTADHRLFEKQIHYFKDKYNILVWDAPGHGLSWPFAFDFDLMDKAKWLKQILALEGILYPVIIGQSIGGYVGQTFSELFPNDLKGFISIDSAPLQRKYVTCIEIWLLKKMEPVYYFIPWKWLLKLGTYGVSTTSYGRQLMHDMMMVYEGDKKRYAKLSGHGSYLLAKGYEMDLKYELHCPALLICGSKDAAGSSIPYCKAWHKKTHIPLVFVKGAGHNANTDAPEFVNELIDNFISNEVCL